MSLTAYPIIELFLFVVPFFIYAILEIRRIDRRQREREREAAQQREGSS